jgi:uncharacterized integral membrane protein (TIGR00698 family)
MDTSRGIIAALAIGVVAFAIDYSLGEQALFSPGASTLALVLGAFAAIWVSDVEPGGKWMTTQVMPIAIVLLGFGLDLDLFLDPDVGVIGLSVAVGAAVSCLLSSYLIGKFMGLDLGTSMAVGAGGAICGNSAVIAVAPSLKLSEEKYGVILAMVNVMGLFTFLFIPILTTALGFNQIEGGIWSGAVVHAVPQAVAAGESIGDEALIIATAVKLSRVSLLILLVPFCAWLGRGISTEEVASEAGFPLPYFVPGFVVAACLATWVLPESISENLTELGKYILLPLLAAVGFFINKKSMQNAGGPVFLVGLLSTLLMVGVSYAMLTLLT